MNAAVWTPDYVDADLTFYMSVHRDHEHADRALGALRRHFPGSRVVVRSDGDDDERHGVFEARYGVEYRAEGHLFGAEHGGAAVVRMFEIFLERPSAFLFKIDPDTEVHRRLRYVPGRDGCFGTLQGPSSCRSIQGGGLGFTRETAARLHRSELLEDPALRNPQSRRGSSPYWEILARRAAERGLASFDWSIGWAATKLGVALFEFPEVRCTWREPVRNDDLRFAITHPASWSMETAP